MTSAPPSPPGARRMLSKLARAAEQPVVRAFGAVVKRQSHRGTLTPAVQATIAESLQLAKVRPTATEPASKDLAAAVRNAALALAGVPGGDGETMVLTPDTEKVLASLLGRLQVSEGHKPRMDSPAVKGLVDAFHRLWYDDRGTWRTTKWQGVTTWKCPLDLWNYQEMIFSLQPGLIIETGTAYGGSANYMASLCDLIGKGRIVTVDIAPKTDDLPKHPRVTYLLGSSTDPGIVEQVKAMITPGEPVMVILDSDHSDAHVRNELLAYADLVTPGSYLIVEDTNVHGHPAFPAHPPGPMEALDWFLTQRSDFTIDRSKHRYHLTLNPRGYLKRNTEE